MIAFLPSFLFVVLAEMGDKTQLLAMAFAMRYPAGKVLWGVFIATVLNHAIAVAAGRFLSAVIPMDIVLLAASLSFILFGLWTIRGDTLDGEDKRPSRYGPVLTVAMAFFIAEMGDKTQLATISLAAKYGNPLAVLMGTTAGMLAADAIGIIAAIVLGKHIPEQAIRWVSAIVFILFGLSGAWRVLLPRLGTWPCLGVIACIGLLTAFAAYQINKRLPCSRYDAGIS